LTYEDSDHPKFIFQTLACPIAIAWSAPLENNPTNRNVFGNLPDVCAQGLKTVEALADTIRHGQQICPSHTTATD
jgi:hypothetical protein